MSRKRLKTLEDCRRYLAGLVNRVESGELDQQSAKTLTYISSHIIGVLKESEIDARLTELEKYANETHGGKSHEERFFKTSFPH